MCVFDPQVFHRIQLFKTKCKFYNREERMKANTKMCYRMTLS